MMKRPPDRRARVGQPRHRLARVDHARTDGQILEQEILTEVDDARRASGVDGDDLGRLQFLRQPHRSSTTGQSWARAMARSRKSGLTATGRPTTASNGKSAYESQKPQQVERSRPFLAQ